MGLEVRRRRRSGEWEVSFGEKGNKQLTGAQVLTGLMSEDAVEMVAWSDQLWRLVLRWWTRWIQLSLFLFFSCLSFMYV